MVGAWHGHGMASVNQTRPHCVNQMGKTHSKPLPAWHGRGTAWARHVMCELIFMEKDLKSNPHSPKNRVCPMPNKLHSKNIVMKPGIFGQDSL